MIDPSKMTVAQLKEELDARGLSTTGKKEELKERLIEALDANEDEDECAFGNLILEEKVVSRNPLASP